MKNLNKNGIFDVKKWLMNKKIEKPKTKWDSLKPFDVNSEKLDFVEFPADQYVPEETKKKQVVLHHTVSDPNNSHGDLSYWISTSQRIATHIIIRNDGKALQCYSSKLWGYHLGAGNSNLDKHSIAIEIDNWGPLKYKKGKFYNAYDQKVKIKDDEVVEFPGDGFRGHNYFPKYTEAQIETVGELLLLFNKKYNIPLKYNEDMWNVSNKALNGKKGIWTHVSFRSDKSDCFPQPELVEMLKSLG